MSRGIAPLCVFGGFRMADHIETRTADGWEVDYDTTDLDPTLYPTEAACLDAIEQQHGYRK